MFKIRKKVIIDLQGMLRQAGHLMFYYLITENEPALISGGRESIGRRVGHFGKYLS
jgi:hypothetical protein